MPVKRPVQPQRQSQLPAGFIGLLRRALADLGFTAGGGGGGGVTDHGALTGLADDDHSHYHNNARGDARYSLLAHNHSGTYDPAGTAAAAVSAHAAAADPHPAYLTATEGNAAYSAIGHGHGGTYDPAGTAAAAVSAHEGAANPHPVYLTQAEGDALYAVAAHSHGSAAISDFAEAVDDRVAALLVAGSNITLTYNDAAGSLTVAASGGGGSDPWTWVKLAANSTVSTTAFAAVSGMSFSALANTTYLVEVVGAYQTAATTTGIALALDIPSGSVIGMNQVSTSATALGGAEQIADATTTGATTGVRAANTNTPIVGRFVVAVGATAGTIRLMQRSEVAASNTVLQAGLTILGYRVI